MDTSLNSFISIFNKIAYGKSESEVFDDFLDICICCLSGQQYEEEYFSIIKRYKPEQINSLCELFAHMIIIMDNDGKGLKDCLGEFFQQNITRGSHGQFFTPEHVCDFMAAITMDKVITNGKTIMDPACGSGRMLLAGAKISRQNYFYGADIDKRCVKTAAINLCLNGLIGEVAWMNSITFEHWGGYSILFDKNRSYIPVIRKVEAQKGYIYEHSMMQLSDMIKQKQEKEKQDQTQNLQYKKQQAEQQPINNASQTKLDL